MLEAHQLANVVEALLFVADEPLPVKKIAEIVEAEPAAVTQALERLRQDYQDHDRGLQLRQIAGGYRLYTHPAYAAYVEKLILAWDARRLTQAALETLAIIAYKQPVTKATISAIRGVNSEGVVGSLAAKGLIREVGREKSPGQPILYGTSNQFLEKFGLNSLKDLPPLAEFEADAEGQTPADQWPAGESSAGHEVDSGEIA